MSDANIELVRRFYEAWNSGDVPRVLDLLDTQDFEFVEPPEFPDARTVSGRAAFAGVLGRQLEERGGFRIECGEIEAVDDRVFAAIAEVATGERSIGRERSFFHAWRVQDGKLARLEVFLTRADAATAAGIPER
jgi:ketosteroid isomerase-like protein